MRCGVKDVRTQGKRPHGGTSGAYFGVGRTRGVDDRKGDDVQLETGVDVSYSDRSRPCVDRPRIMSGPRFVSRTCVDHDVFNSLCFVVVGDRVDVPGSPTPWRNIITVSFVSPTLSTCVV